MKAAVTARQVSLWAVVVSNKSVGDWPGICQGDPFAKFCSIANLKETCGCLVSVDHRFVQRASCHLSDPCLDDESLWQASCVTLVRGPRKAVRQRNAASKTRGRGRGARGLRFGAMCI